MTKNKLYLYKILYMFEYKKILIIYITWKNQLLQEHFSTNQKNQ